MKKLELRLASMNYCEIKNNMDMTSATIELAKTLIARESLTPNDAGCQEIIAEKLEPLGFKIKNLPFGDVKNLWARRGHQEPVLVFAGHTDVVPPGPLAQWTHNPFHPTVHDNKLFGRGAADMKGSIAAMIIACEIFIKQFPNHAGSIAFLITSDEEGIGIDGTAKVVEYLRNKNEKINYCIVGEASSEKQFGDTIKIGRRGSLHGKLTILGKQGHIAYPHLSDNPIHRITPAIADLANEIWDQGNTEFPPTTFQISNIHSGTGADNVIPGTLELMFNFRFSTAVTVEELQRRIIGILQRHSLQYQLDWRVSAKPFLTPEGKLLDATRQALRDIAQVEPKTSTGGGTSDARFISTLGCEVLEIGPINHSIHKIDEHVAIEDLTLLTQVYANIIQRLLV